MRKKGLILLLLILSFCMVFLLSACSEDNPEVVKKDQQEEDGQDVPSECRLGDTIAYKDFDLIIDNQREVPGITDESYLIFDVTIISKKNDLSFFGDIQGVTKDNEVIDDTIPFVEENIGDSIMTAWTKTLNEDQKAKGYIAFDKEISKIEIRSSFFKNDLISVVVD